MWANAQRDGRAAEYRWRPLFNAAKFDWRPLLECRAVTLPIFRVAQNKPTIYFCCPSSVFLKQNMFHNALNWSTWYSCFTCNFWWRLTWAWLTFLSVNQFINDDNVRQCCLTNEQIEVDRYPSFCQRFVNILIKLFKVLRFHCLAGNSFIILSLPHPFSTRNARINTLSSLVNGRVFIFTSTTSAMTSHRTLITEEYLTARLLFCALICLCVTSINGVILCKFS